MKLLVTGSSGLIGSECVLQMSKSFKSVIGIDNNMRKDFFGAGGDTTNIKKRLLSEIHNYRHFDIDIRDRNRILDIFKQEKPSAIIHCAAQPSHDLAASRPFDDFEVNAVGTLNLLECARQQTKDSPFIFMSTNKVYGDAPNNIPLIELPTRWEYADDKYLNGVDESFSIDQSKHSIFGASKVAADILVQEYGRYFNMPTASFRGGCLTGSRHAAVELHGYLAYIFKCAIEHKPYTIYGYKGKQVRDQIHSSDVVSAFQAFLNNPRAGEVYNLGGGKDNSISILESIEIIKSITEQELIYSYSEINRSGDHICYYSNLSKIKAHFPDWQIRVSIKEIIQDMWNSFKIGLK